MSFNVAELAALAQLELSPDEAAAMQRDLAAILDYVRRLDAIATEGVEPLAHVTGEVTPMRADATRPCFTPAEALANAPQSRAGLFQVPSILERGERGGEPK